MSDFEILQQLCETADELSKKYISSIASKMLV